MSYLAQGLIGGFQQGFAASTQAKRDKKLEEERKAERALQQSIHEDQLSRQQERQMVEDARYDTTQRERDKRQQIEDARYEQQRLDANTRDTRDFEFKRGAYADTRLDRTMEQSRQARQDFSAEIDKARLDPLKESLLTEQARGLQLENDLRANPRPTERLEFSPDDPSGAPKRVITGTAGTLGEFATAGRPASDPTANLSAQDLSAYQWAQSNPDDPRAAAILKRLGLAK